ncbi:MAG: hypothetical protein KJ659_03180 [Actinobacteria bacterium]|nr:hypothetical protein [Actinomycetota bacterium]MBU1610016.1 hypothetical protein [Actinomycetota bacterium]MBU2315616.1 hypothetical protein [Actinomycetota bacterium]MBU2384491.1 hypothetical protein [Actinomycetota bacterium]
MDTSGGGTAILIALAAGLWLLYLVPMWRRRSEYLATERNAVRLQQTLRIMAQTTELPEAVRAEMTAREIAAQERSLAARQREQLAIERAREAARQRALRAQLASTAPGLVAEVDASRLGQRRLRRSRAGTSLLTFAALVGVGVSIAFGAWAWTGLAGFVALSGMLLLRGLARASHRRTASAEPAAPRFVDYAPAAPATGRQAPRERAWTPVPLPRPTYLDAPAAPAMARDAQPTIDHAAVLAAAAAEAERAQRRAQTPAAPAETRSPAEREAPAARVAAEPGDSRFARMGIVDGLPTKAPDLDEVLQRRRAAG